MKRSTERCASRATPKRRPRAFPTLQRRAGRSSIGKSGGDSGSYDDWTVPQPKKRAKELGISGYSSLATNKLISKLRNH
jgi:hypothetical protein